MIIDGLIMQLLKPMIWLVIGIAGLGGQVMAAGFVQQGFYLHDTETSGLLISDAQSGTLCVVDGTPQVCTPSMKIVVTGEELCEHSAEQPYPCTRYGYQFDYADAKIGSVMDCVAIYTDTRGRKKTPYQHQLSQANGHVYYPAFKTFAEVDKRIILSEVHECSYLGTPLMAIEFMHYYEPETTDNSQPAPSRPVINTVPNACATPHLTEQKAEQLLRSAVRPLAANEHIPNFWSQCIYRSKTVAARDIGFVYKFMVAEMFDVHTLTAEQLQFNATFAAGNATFSQVIDDLGDRSFVFKSDKRTTLLVITGIAGPNDGADRPSLLIANYYLQDTEMTHSERQALLTAEAREDLADWLN